MGRRRRAARLYLGLALPPGRSRDRLSAKDGSRLRRRLQRLCDVRRPAEVGAVGFVGNATDATARFFGNATGKGTMPHALVGYAGSTLRAAEMFHEAFPEETLTVLVDYFGLEVTDSLAVCRRFPELVAQGRLALRI